MSQNQQAENTALPQSKVSGFKSHVKSLKRVVSSISDKEAALITAIVAPVTCGSLIAVGMPLAVPIIVTGASAVIVIGYFMDRWEADKIGKSGKIALGKGKKSYHWFKANVTKDGVIVEPLQMKEETQERNDHLLSSLLPQTEPKMVTVRILEKEECSIHRAKFFSVTPANPEVNDNFVSKCDPVTFHK